MDTYDIMYGAAQGSCLGPLLFIVFCNDIHLLPLIGTLILFADDTTLLNSSKYKAYLEYSMRHYLKLLDEWFNGQSAVINLSKTANELLAKWEDIKLDLENTPIPTVTTTNFLGVYLNNQLTLEVSY